MTLKGGILTFVHTKVTFQDFNALERGMAGAYYAHTQEGEGLVVPGTERHERLFEVRTLTYAEAIIGFTRENASLA